MHHLLPGSYNSNTLNVRQFMSIAGSQKIACSTSCRTCPCPAHVQTVSQSSSRSWCFRMVSLEGFQRWQNDDTIVFLVQMCAVCRKMMLSILKTSKSGERPHFFMPSKEAGRPPPYNRRRVSPFPGYRNGTRSVPDILCLSTCLPYRKTIYCNALEPAECNIS